MSEMEMLEKKIDDLDRRVKTLEEAQHARVWDKGENIADNLLVRYGEYVDKTVASKILGVTRATVYAMLADGRIESACGGRRVAVRSIAKYLASPKTPAPTRKGGA